MISKKFIVVSIITSLAFVLFNLSVYAHSSSSCNPGSESKGWLVYCNNYSNGHIGTPSYTYKYSPDLKSEYKSYTSTGVSRWNMTGIVNISYSSYSNNVIFHHDDPNSSVVARVSSSALNNHKTRWNLSYNDAKMPNYGTSEKNGIATHEIGHTIGLKNLENSTNKNKLMYGTQARTVNYPQFADIEGAKEGVK